MRVLREIGADQVPQILVWNKLDLTAARPGIERDDCGNISCVRLSARTGAGLPDLREALAEAASVRARAKRGSRLNSQPFFHFPFENT
jgi:GTP-binding protein HflX